MEILEVLPRYIPYIGGVENVIRITVLQLRKRGYKVTVLAGHPRLVKPKKEKIDGIDVLRWPTIAPRESYHFPIYMLLYTALLLKLSKKYRIIHIHSFHAFFSIVSLILFSKLKANNQKIIFSPHYIGISNKFFRRILTVFVIYIFLKSTKDIDKFIFSTNWEKEIFTRQILGEKNIRKTAVINYPVYEDYFHIKKKEKSTDEIIITMSGRIDLRQKRYDLLIKSIACVLKKNCVHGKRIILRIIGDGPDFNKINDLINKYNLKENVEIYRNIPRKTYVEKISTSTIYILLSEGENYGLSPREAICMNIPVIVSKNSALLELIQEGLAIGVKNEEKDICNKICGLIKIIDERKTTNKRSPSYYRWHPKNYIKLLVREYKG